MGSCTSKKTRRVIETIAESEELRSLITKLYYDTLLEEDPTIRDTIHKKRYDERLKKVQKHFTSSNYIDNLI